MQSLIQYRRAGIAAQAQLDHDAASYTTTNQTRPAQNHDTNAEQGRFANQGPEPPLTATLSGIEDRDYQTACQVFIIGWASPHDPLKPHNWPTLTRIGVTIQISLVGLVITASSAIDSVVLPQAAQDLGVSEVAESLATGLFLAGMGLGSLIAGPFSETFGRNAVYSVSLLVYMVWIMAAGLAPNLGAQLIFRFLAGCSASTPLVCAGGSIADMFDWVEKTWAFPLFAIISFTGPMIGPVMGAYIGPSSALSWRWAEWVMLIAAAVVLVVILLFMPETYGPVLLQWKAAHYRRITGENRFRCEHEITDTTILSRLRVNMTRPFYMLTEPIIAVLTLYITVLYIVLFTFLVGWPLIFQETYSISQGLANVIFIAMAIGTWSNFLLLPFIYRKTLRYFKKRKPEPFEPEVRLWWGTLGSSVAIPVSLFWMAWTDYPSISIWSPILAATMFGYGVAGVFICIYMYIIDTYEVYSASALTFVSLVRYIVAGGMTVVGVPFYQDLGTHYTLTILACIAALLAPVPFALYYFGHKIRVKSKFAVA